MQNLEAFSSILSRNRDRLILFIVFLVEFLLLYLFSWPNVIHWGLRGTNFMDMVATINFVECYKEYGLAVYGTVIQESCSNYVYGTFVIALLFLVSSTTWFPFFVGFVSIVLISGVLAYCLSLMKSRQPYKFLLGSTLVVSPPISLLAERGNIDSLIIFMLLTSLILCHSKPKQFSGFILLAITCLIKFYTLPLLAIVFISQKRYLKTPQSLLFVFTTIWTMHDFLRIQSLPTVSPYASFGNHLFGDYLAQFYEDTALVSTGGIVLGFVTFVFGIVIFRSILRRLVSDLTFSEKPQSIFVSFNFFVVFLSCYFAGRNYDYRLLILVISIYLLLPICPRGTRTPILAGSFLILFLSYNVNPMLQALGDVTLLALLSFLSALFFVNRTALTGIVPQYFRNKPTPNPF